MAGIDEVLERLLTDASFAQQLARDPSAALAGYSLSQDDLRLLSTQVSFDPGALSLVEERISKAGMFGLLTSFTAGLGGLTDLSVGQSADPHMLPDNHLDGIVAPVDSHVPDVGEGVIGPTDSGETHGIIVFGSEEKAPGAGGGDGSEVSIKEVDPSPAPSVGLVDPADKVGFNPQPDPPGIGDKLGAGGIIIND